MIVYVNRIGGMPVLHIQAGVRRAASNAGISTAPLSEQGAIVVAAALTDAAAQLIERDPKMSEASDVLEAFSRLLRRMKE